tara:strand:+ start:367 stop:519 length:153 start_codon:yes stop_codon:yes gene_type:complete
MECGNKIENWMFNGRVGIICADETKKCLDPVLTGADWKKLEEIEWVENER